MTEDRLRSYGVFLLRVALGTMFIAHSTIYMLMTLTLAGTGKFFVSIGLPAWLAYATFLAEAVGGILLILGIQTRWVALALSPILMRATWAHSGNGWLFAATNGGWEYPLYLFVLCIAQAMLGDGAYALAPSRLSVSGVSPPSNAEARLAVILGQQERARVVMQLPQVWLETSVASISANARKVNQEGVRLASIPLKRGPSHQSYVPLTRIEVTRCIALPTPWPTTPMPSPAEAID